MTPEINQEDACRTEILARNVTCVPSLRTRSWFILTPQCPCLRCYMECDTCIKQCTSPLARTLNSMYKCSVGLPVVGINAAARITDQGTDVMKRHGAVRREGRKPIPQSVYPELHDTIINNDIAYPRVARNCTVMRLEPLGEVSSPLGITDHPLLPCARSGQLPQGPP